MACEPWGSHAIVLYLLHRPRKNPPKALGEGIEITEKYRGDRLHRDYRFHSLHFFHPFCVLPSPQKCLNRPAVHDYKSQR